jgi:hypothetical protein
MYPSDLEFSQLQNTQFEHEVQCPRGYCYFSSVCEQRVQHVYGDGDIQVPWQHQGPLAACLSKWEDLRILASTGCEGIVAGFHWQ